MHVFFSAGEHSGDIAAARLLAEMRRLEPDIVVSGLGGRGLAAAGAKVEAWTTQIGAVGVSEVVGVIPAALRAFRHVRARLLAAPPDVAVLVGNDVFNVTLARWLRRHGIPVVSYFPPQPWVWRTLAGPIARSFDAMLTCFPVEQDVYEPYHTAGAVSYVGHYLAADLTLTTDTMRAAARRRHGLEPDASIVGLLPGSRRHEIQQLAPVLLDAAVALRAQDPSLRFVLPLTDDAERTRLQPAVDGRGLGDIVCWSSDSHDAMRASDVLAVASGTATLEAALLGVPMVIVYRVARLTHAVIRGCLRTGVIASYTFGLPNLLAGRRIVPELGQAQVTPELVAGELHALLTDDHRRTVQRDALTTVGRQLLRPDGVREAAATIFDLIGGRRGSVNAYPRPDARPSRSVTAEPEHVRPEALP